MLNLNLNVTLDINEEQLRQIITEYVARNTTEYKVKKITFSYGSRMAGYGMTERAEAYFDGAKVELEPKNV